MGLPFFVSFRFLIQGPSILRQPLYYDKNKLGVEFSKIEVESKSSFNSLLMRLKGY